jgi:hypothetical protein
MDSCCEIHISMLNMNARLTKQSLSISKLSHKIEESSLKMDTVKRPYFDTLFTENSVFSLKYSLVAPLKIFGGMSKF